VDWVLSHVRNTCSLAAVSAANCAIAHAANFRRFGEVFSPKKLAELLCRGRDLSRCPIGDDLEPNRDGRYRWIGVLMKEVSRCAVPTGAPTL